MSIHRLPELPMQRRHALWPLAMLCLVCLLVVRVSLAAEVPAAPATAGAVANTSGGLDSRAAINRQERALMAQYDAEVRACQQRFVVTSCVDDVRTRRRAALAPLRDAALRLAEAERRQQANLRRAVVERKQRAQAERGPEPAPAPAPAASGAAMRPRSPWHAPSAGPRDDAASAAIERAQAARRRQAQGEATQARIARRQAEQAEKGQAAAPLPPMPAPSAAQR